MLITCSKCNSHVETGDAAPGDILNCRCGMGIMVPEAPATAGKMGCPNCGASIDPELRVCEFCGTKLATVLCPTCFGAVFDGAKHCVHCGDNLERHKVVHHGDETKHECPRCSGPHLRIEVVAGHAIERCSECEGLWVEDAAVERIYKDVEKSNEVQAVTAVNRVKPTGTGEFPSQGYVKCPECQKLMNRQNFGRFSGVIIDTCKGHGTWFDADELRRILEFIEAGGLEKQASRERDELKEELRKMRSDARSEANKAARDRRRSGTGGVGRLVGGSSALAIGGLLKKIL